MPRSRHRVGAAKGIDEDSTELHATNVAADLGADLIVVGAQGLL
jgi:hypothetical protein